MERDSSTLRYSINETHLEDINMSSHKYKRTRSDKDIELTMDIIEKPVENSSLIRECLAELIGTFILLSFGNGVCAQTVISNGSGGSWLGINFGWGLGVTFGVFASGGISGGHLNPAVSLTMCCYGRLPWYKLPFYALSQFLGAFLGALTVFVMYYPGLNSLDNMYTKSTAGIFATYPQSYMTTGSAFVTEVIATVILLLCVFSLGDQKNQPVGPYLGPVVVGFLVLGIGICFGFNTGYAINPARDFGPRVFTSIAGWGSSVFTYDSHYFWIPIVAPCIGGVIGGGIYTFLIENFHPRT